MQIDWWTLGLQAVNALVLIWLLGACPGNSKKRSGQGASSSIRWTV